MCGLQSAICCYFNYKEMYALKKGNSRFFMHWHVKFLFPIIILRLRIHVKLQVYSIQFTWLYLIFNITKVRFSFCALPSSSPLMEMIGSPLFDEHVF